MKKHPLKTIGVVFSCVAAVELTVLLVILLFSPSMADPIAPMILCGVLGMQILVFGGIGLGLLTHVRRREVRRETLLNNGYYETAYVVEIERVYNVRINGRCPYRVICRIERDGMLHEYRSDIYRDDPGLKIGDPVRVYLDRREDHLYYVDVDSSAPTIVRHG